MPAESMKTSSVRMERRPLEAVSSRFLMADQIAVIGVEIGAPQPEKVHHDVQGEVDAAVAGVARPLSSSPVCWST